MAKRGQHKRRIALFVEGDSERALPQFFHKWLNSKLPNMSSVGIHAVKFQGVSEFLYDLPTKIDLYLTERKANFVVGLVDLYGIPSNQINLSNHRTTAAKVVAARKHVRGLVAPKFRDRFRQHFAVHEVEAWLLAYPHEWPTHVRNQIQKRPPEQVNFNEPPAKLLKRLLGTRYKKTVYAKKLFPKVDPQIAIAKCPFLKLLADDLLRIARLL